MQGQSSALGLPHFGTIISESGQSYTWGENTHEFRLTPWHNEDGIHSELTVYVAIDASVKFSVLKVRNQSNRNRKLSAPGYVEWVLGDLRPKTTPYVVTDCLVPGGALFASNPYNTEFADRVAFFDVDDVTRTKSGDRTEFIGRNGTLSRPAAMNRSHLSGNVGAVLDPYAALQVAFELGAGQE